jgi:tetrahydromethanopterin S-methyltransferase subunit G
MARISEDNESKSSIRIRITEKNLSEWNIKTRDDAVIKNWINIGRERDKINSRLDQIENKLDRFIQMIGQFTHQTFIATTSLQNDINKELASCKDKEQTPFMKLIETRYRQSFNLRDHYFPEFKIPGLLNDPDDEFNERMQRMKENEC